MIASIRTVNLVWEKKHRGAYPPSVYALNDAGSLALASPRPLEPRTYDLGIHDADGAINVCWGFSAETLLKMEVSHGSACVGMTSDDMYLFQDRSKSRFLADKHVNYIDVAISADGRRFVTAFSDLAGASFAVAYGEIGGRQIWLHEVDSPLTAVGISRDGTRTAIGVESGALSLLDSARREVWCFELEVPIKAVACSADGGRVVYAELGGGVGIISGDGARLWETNVTGEVVAMALSADGALCALLAVAADDPSARATIHCLLEDGSTGWQHDTERRCTGISLSPDGGHLAVGARDGLVSLYRIVAGDESGRDPADTGGSAIVQASVLMAAGDIQSACGVLKTALALNPADLRLHSEYCSTRESWRSSALESADGDMERGDARAAIRTYAALLDDDPLFTVAADRLRTARELRARQLIEESQVQEDGDLGAAERSLREAVAVSPADRAEARQALAALLERSASSGDALADELVRQAHPDEALEALILAQNRRPSAQRAERIRALQSECEFAAGMAAYNAKRYEEAVFQFKKVLRLDKNHADAVRHLEFARRFSQDTVTDSLQDRFSRIE